MTNCDRAIKIVQYDPNWVEEFRMYASKLNTALGELAVSIEHIGSTSVIGLAAKPIIDIDVIISSRIVLEKVIETLASIDYIHQGSLGIPGREAFVKAEEKRLHLYVCSIDTPNLHNHLIFRDYLRTHLNEVKAYSELKQQLALQHYNNREMYTESKTKFIDNILVKAQAEYGFHTFQSKGK